MDDSRCFNVKKLKEILDNGGDSSHDRLDPTPWFKIVPKKVCVFIWRAIKGRLPCHLVLDKGGIDLDSILCPKCGEEIERWTMLW